MQVRNDFTSKILLPITQNNIEGAERFFVELLITDSNLNSLKDMLHLIEKKMLSWNAYEPLKKVAINSLTTVAASDDIFDKNETQELWYRFFLKHSIPISKNAVTRHSNALESIFRKFYHDYHATRNYDQLNYLFVAAIGLKLNDALNLFYLDFIKISTDAISNMNLMLSQFPPPLLSICIDYLFDLSQTLFTLFNSIKHIENPGLIDQLVIDVNERDSAGNNLLLSALKNNDKVAHSFHQLLEKPFDLTARNVLGETVFTCQSKIATRDFLYFQTLITKLCKKYNTDNLLAIPNLRQLVGLQRHDLNHEKMGKLKFRSEKNELIVILENNKTVSIPWKALPLAAKSTHHFSAFYYEIALWLVSNGHPNYLGELKNLNAQLDSLELPDVIYLHQFLMRTTLGYFVLACQEEIDINARLQIKYNGTTYPFSLLTSALINDQPQFYTELREKGFKHEASDLVIKLTKYDTNGLKRMLDSVFLANYINDAPVNLEKYLSEALLIAANASNLALFKQILNISPAHISKILSETAKSIFLNPYFYYRNEFVFDIMQFFHENAWYEVLTGNGASPDYDKFLYKYFKKQEFEDSHIVNPNHEKIVTSLKQTDLPIAKAWLACHPRVRSVFVEFQSASQGNIKLPVSLLTIASIQPNKWLYNNLTLYQYLPTDLLVNIICSKEDEALPDGFLGDYFMERIYSNYFEENEHLKFLDAAFKEAVESKKILIQEQIVNYYLDRYLVPDFVINQFNLLTHQMQTKIIDNCLETAAYNILPLLFKNDVNNELLIAYFLKNFNGYRFVHLKFKSLDDMKYVLACVPYDRATIDVAFNSSAFGLCEWDVSFLTYASIKDKALYNQLREKTKCSHLSYDLLLHVIYSTNELLDADFLNNYKRDRKREYTAVEALQEAAGRKKFAIFNQIITYFPLSVCNDNIVKLILENKELGLNTIKCIVLNETGYTALQTFFEKPATKDLFNQYVLLSVTHEKDAEYKIDLPKMLPYKIYLACNPEITFITLSHTFEVKRYPCEISLLTCASMENDKALYETSRSQKNLRHSPTDLLMMIKYSETPKLNEEFVDNYLADMKLRNLPNPSEYLITALLMAIHKNKFELFDQILIKTNDILSNAYADLMREIIELFSTINERYYHMDKGLFHFFTKEPGVEHALVAFFINKSPLKDSHYWQQEEEKQPNLEDIFRHAYGADKPHSGKTTLSYLETKLSLQRQTTTRNKIDLVSYILKSSRQEDLNQYIRQYIQSHPKRGSMTPSGTIYTLNDLKHVLPEWKLEGSLSLLVPKPGYLSMFANKINLADFLEQLQQKTPEKFREICQSQESYVQFLQQFNPEAEAKPSAARALINGGFL